MPPFSGFPAGKSRLTPLPAVFFRELLPQIDDLAELKIILYAFWFLNQQQEPVRYITFQDFLEDRTLIESLAEDPHAAKKILQAALVGAVKRGALLEAGLPGENERKSFYFLNSPHGRAAVKALEAGTWSPDPSSHASPVLERERPTIFKLYEENIGPLTPMIAEILRDAEQTYPVEWIEEALQIAVENNVRRWRYVEAILISWQEKGRHGTDRQDVEKDREYYLKGDSSEYIER